MNATTTSTLTLLAQHLNIWFGSFLLLVGNVGCIINIIVFRAKSFHRSSFSIYFLATTIADLFLLNFVLFTRILQNGFLLPIFQTHQYLCKLRAYISAVTSSLSCTFFIMVSIDRYLCTHPQAFYRSWGNQYSLAIKLISSLSLFWMIVLSYRLFVYDIDPNSGICQSTIGYFWWYQSFIKFVFTGLAPPIAILVLSTLIIRNVRAVVHHHHTRTLMPMIGQTKNKISRLQKLDHQLTSILLIQLGVSFISFLPYSSELLYATLSHNIRKSDLYLSWEYLIIEFIHLSSYIFYSTNCYVFIASSPLFRKQISQIFHCDQLQYSLKY